MYFRNLHSLYSRSWILTKIFEKLYVIVQNANDGWQIRNAYLLYDSFGQPSRQAQSFYFHGEANLIYPIWSATEKKKKKRVSKRKRESKREREVSMKLLNAMVVKIYQIKKRKKFGGFRDTWGSFDSFSFVNDFRAPLDFKMWMQ